MAEHAHTTPFPRPQSVRQVTRPRRKSPAPLFLPEVPLTADEIRRNLDTAVLLAQQAARHGGELAEHFGELGRRFGHLLEEVPPKQRLRMVKGGAA